MDDFERSLLLGTLDRLKQLGQTPSMSRAAELLGTSREFVRRRLEALGVKTVAPPKKDNLPPEERKKALKAAHKALAEQRAALRKSDAVKLAAQAAAPINDKQAPERPQEEPLEPPEPPTSPENPLPGVPGEVA